MTIDRAGEFKPSEPPESISKGAKPLRPPRTGKVGLPGKANQAASNAGIIKKTGERPALVHPGKSLPTPPSTESSAPIDRALASVASKSKRPRPTLHVAGNQEALQAMNHLNTLKEQKNTMVGLFEQIKPNESNLGVNRELKSLYTHIQNTLNECKPIMKKDKDFNKACGDEITAMREAIEKFDDSLPERSLVHHAAREAIQNLATMELVVQANANR